MNSDARLQPSDAAENSVAVASIPRSHRKAGVESGRTMMRSGCEKVCPTFRSSFGNSRPEMLSAVTGRIFLAKMGRNFCISQSFSSARWNFLDFVLTLHAFIGGGPWPDPEHNDSFLCFRDPVDQAIIAMETHSSCIRLSTHLKGSSQHWVFGQFLQERRSILLRSVA
jgi:hypothetical protein